MQRLIFSLLILLFFSCQQQEKPEVEEETPLKWEQVGFNLDRQLLASSESDGSMTLLFRDQLVEIDNMLNMQELLSFSDALNVNPTPIIQNDFLVYSESYQRLGQDSINFVIVDTRDPNKRALIDLDRFNLSLAFNVEVAAVNDDMQLLLVLKNNDERALYGLSYQIQELPDRLELQNQQLFNIAPIATGEITKITALGNYFYLSDFDAVYRLSANGNIDRAIESMLRSNPFVLGNLDYMMTSDGFYQSNDQGLSWQKSTAQADQLFDIPIHIIGNSSNGQLIYLQDEQRYWDQSAIKMTTDLIDIEPLMVENDENTKRLHVMDNYLYGLRDNGTLYRVLLPE
ncbi:MAG: hypothetical protein AAFO07_02080 [Bacteroidota bacterium]